MPTIRFLTSGTDVDFPDGEDVNLLRVALRNKCGVPFKCATGLCGTDRVRIVDGAEHLSPPKRRERELLGDLLDEGVRLACQTYVSGPVSLYWDPDQKSIDEDSRAGKRLLAEWLDAEDGQ
ncbi:2Fe-2S iron-sulfur cluster-binding protein [Candidatus Poriferisocius sp.]|uniref:2Fe-2S iron-sulfur cluster-binding protein n=1 Tax=Candidatus Poriferisocius sp. TaxID=3101276 RepID=UPI003B5C507E